MVAKSSQPAESAVVSDGSRVPLWPLLKGAGKDWMEDRATRLAASLAFYTMLSLAPLLVLAVSLLGKLFKEDAARHHVQTYLTDVMGPKTAGTVMEMIGPLSRPGSGMVATIISSVILCMSASGVFGELQDSLNTIWEVKPRPNRGILGILRERFVPFVLVLGICFLLLVSMIATTVLAGLTKQLSGQGPVWVWHVVNIVASFIVVGLVFALMFKYLPDAKVRWRDVWPGAIGTAVLFTVGKFFLGWYLGRASTTSVYAAAGSLLSVLLWVYYSSQILFFGAEMTKAHARMSCGQITPADNAVKVTGNEREQQGMVSTDRLNQLDEQSPSPAETETSSDGVSAKAH